MGIAMAYSLASIALYIKMSLHVVFERCRFASLRCQTCKQKIDRSALCIAKRSVKGIKHYHMACYEPPEAQIIDCSRHIRLKKYVKEDWETVKQWVEEWNSRFKVSEETLPPQFISKAVETTSSLMRRLLLETFEYLEIKEIEQIVAFVCKEWFHVSRDNELWKARYLASYQPSNTNEMDTYRSKFIVRNQSCCWLCRQHVDLKEIKLMCPVHKRPLCRDCFQTDAGCIITLNSYFHDKKIASTLVARLGFRHFIYDRFKQNYLSDLGDTILPYAEQRKQALLSALQPLCPAEISEEDFDAIGNYDLKDYYKLIFPYPYGPVIKSLSVFCGLDDEKQLFEEDVKDFLLLLKYNSRFSH